MNATRHTMSRATGLITFVVLISALGMSGLTVSDANAQDSKRRMSTGSTSSASSRTTGRQVQRTNSRTSIGVSPRRAGANSAKRGQRRARGRSASDVSDGAPDWENSSVQPPPSRNPVREYGEAPEEDRAALYRNSSSRSLMQQQAQSAATAPPPTPPPLPPGTPQQARQAQNTGTVSRTSSSGSQMTFSRRPSK